MVEDKFVKKNINKLPKKYVIMEKAAMSQMVAEGTLEYSSKGSN